MANNINVTIHSDDPPLLSVDDNGGQNSVKADPRPTTIKWNLTEGAAKGAFLPLDGRTPGFSWVPPEPPKGLFCDATVGPGGNSLIIVDNHLDDKSNGQWIYMLRMSLDGKVYTTTASIDPRTGVNNPIIINR